MTLWTLKSVLNVVVKIVVSDWIRLALFGKETKSLKGRSGIIGRGITERHECLYKDNTQVVKSLRFNKMLLFMNYEFLSVLRSWL